MALTDEVKKTIDELREHLKVKRDGETLYYLNPCMALKQGLSAEEVDKVASIHVKLQDLFDKMRDEADPRQLPSYIPKVEQLEFDLQEAWKFDKDVKKHSWWYRVPHCTCPKLDNRDSWGSGQRIISKECPVHGGLLPKK